MDAPDRSLVFDALPDTTGLEIVDRIEQERCVCRTDEEISPIEATVERFRFPVDRAVRFSATELTLPNVAGVLVRDESGDIIRQVQQLESEELPEDNYSIELLTQFKTYLAVKSSATIAGDGVEFSVDFGTETDVVLGAMSNHERPAATVTTTTDPLDMMAAVETFGSALKTTSPDRSFPSLRGHPPAVEIGEELDIPASIETPDTGITIQLPLRRESLYVAAPLVYYIGANLESGPSAKLVTQNGFEHSLTGPYGYEQNVERALKQIFFLDCLTRTEGLHKLELHERNKLERLVDIDFASLYSHSISEQVEAYLEVPFEVVEDHLPDWRLTAHVEPDVSTIEQLPFVIDDLAIVRTKTSDHAESKSATAMPAGMNLDDEFTRSAESESNQAEVEYVEPQSTESLEQAWIGDDIPVGASKLTREAFQNRLDLAPVDGDISITIVLNDPRMDEERSLADRAYGNRETLPFDVEVHRDVKTGELREILAEDTAFLHYIGHTERDGFECPDGKLDARSLGETGVQTFLLNACNSYEQGLGLIEAGAVGGIVTLSDVINDGAVRIGETVARLLNAGFPLRGTLTIARDESVLGGQYIVVGDGGMTVAQPSSGTPYLVKLSQEKGSEFQAEIETFTTDVAGLGAVFKPNISGADGFYLSSGSISTFEMEESELLQFLKMEDFPIRMDGELYWSSSISLEKVV